MLVLATTVNLSLGKTLSLHPFFVTYATDKEMALWICDLCLNKRLCFISLQRWYI